MLTAFADCCENPLIPTTPLPSPIIQTWPVSGPCYLTNGQDVHVCKQEISLWYALKFMPMRPSFLYFHVRGLWNAHNLFYDITTEIYLVQTHWIKSVSLWWEPIPLVIRFFSLVKNIVWPIRRLIRFVSQVRKFVSFFPAFRGDHAK